MILMKKGDELYIFPDANLSYKVNRGYKLIKHLNITKSGWPTYSMGRSMKELIEYQQTLILKLENTLKKRQEILSVLKNIEEKYIGESNGNKDRGSKNIKS